MAGPVDVSVFGQNSRDDGKALDRLRAHHRDAVDAIDRVLDRLGDEDLDLLGRESGRFGLDRDLGRGEFGKDVKLGAGEDIETVDDQRERETDYDPAVPDRPAQSRARR